ncbi:hypothetical protein T440DRAFT_485424 [Plenodomus tracheiphilus IPT5]|uniref:RRM domain-containing protein n=1 Tax=Plenodomus tracheiphilus IPT5 TaxID=1408161 RepID=A0A6A7BLP7_9PLEO|nr:hypothetical protein T440DRAFT_485424 [Plenodomus tracheiphilus IPT5]
MTNEYLDEFLRANDTAAETSVNILTTEPQTKKRKITQEADASKKPKVQENRAIYVTNLPRDTTEEELEQTFKKYGIIDQGADGHPRIKMYSDDEGNFNGEALIVYFKKDSIPLAIRMMDDYYFRLEDQTAGTIRVKEADFAYKRNKDSDQIASKLTRKDKKASERNRADLNRKLAEWSDNEEEVAEAYAPKKNKWAKVVILKYAFTLEELEEDAANLLDIKEDIRTEAETFGAVTNVTLYDKEVDGICSVRFREFEDAEKFRARSNGRKFASRKLEAWLAEDKPKFKKSARVEEPDSEDEERLEKVAK